MDIWSDAEATNADDDGGLIGRSFAEIVSRTVKDWNYRLQRPIVGSQKLWFEISPALPPDKHGRFIVRAATRLMGVGIVGLSLFLAGCDTRRLMMPTPNVHLDTARDFFSDLTPQLKSTEVPLFYITDRAPEQGEDGNHRYGYGRSASLAFGSVVVDVGTGITWEDLLEASRTQQRLRPTVLEVRSVKEIVRSPNLPLPFREVEGRIVQPADQANELARAEKTFRQVLAKQLELTPRKEVFVYIHGYNNGFDDAAYAMAELWHFTGRIGVPIIYTWPAGYPGLFGYTYDRESSEFTVYHLREMLRIISDYPEVEKIHLIAHSRGTDVAVSALRELTIGARVAGIDPRKRYKIHNLILAAPDLDLQVATQRLMGDRLSLSVRRLTVYASPADKAIGISTSLFSSPRGRVGTLGLEDLGPTLRAQMAFTSGNSAVISFTGTSDQRLDQYGHSYFRNAAAVSSDVVLTLRDDLDPGSPGRPLEPISAGFWRIPEEYPRENSQK